MASFYFLLSLLMFPLLLFLNSILKSLYANQNYRQPPGPWVLPIIGSIHHFIGRGLPHHALRDLSQRYGGLMFLQLGEHPTVVVSSREAAKEIMKTHDLKFCDRPVNNALQLVDYFGKDIVFAPYGELWREMKRFAVLGLLGSKRVQSFRSIREEEANNLIKHISSVSCTKQFLNLSNTLLSFVNDMTLRAITGSKSKEKDMIIREILNSVEFIAMFKIANLFPSLYFVSMLTGVERRAKQCRDCVKQFVGDIIEEHRQKEGSGDANDVITVLLRQYNEDSENNTLSMDSIVAVIFDLITGGTETLSAILAWAMAELIRNPGVMKTTQRKIRQKLQGHEDITESDLVDLSIVHLIIKETIRLHPPNPLLIPRECRETCNILGYDIPKGTTVIVNEWDMGRNPKYWKDAEEFKPERFLEVEVGVESESEDFKFTPFGAGRRACPGALFGLAIIELVLANLLFHFDWELPDGMSPEELDMTEAFGITARRKSPLLLRPVPRQC